MALVRETIVKEDLDLGYGTVSKTADAGGALTGNKIGLHTFTGSFNVQDFGATGDGVTDDSAAIAAAVAVAQSAGGGCVYFPTPRAQYLVKSEILVTADKMFLKGASRRVELRAGTANQNIIHWNAKHGGMSELTLNGNNLSGTSGLRLSGTSETQTTVQVVTSFNSFRDVNIQNCDEAVVLRTGPTVLGAQSDCSYNKFFGLTCTDNFRGVWLLQHPTDTTAATCDSNQFFGVLINSQGTRCNTGFQIDAGSTCSFFGCSTIGMENGTAPNTIPTSIYILGKAPLSGSNNNSTFIFGQRSEFDTRQLYISSADAHYTTVIGSVFQTAKIFDNGTTSIILIAGNQDKGIWYSYSDSTGIPAIDPPAGLGVKVRNSAGGTANSAFSIEDLSRAYNGEIGSFVVALAADLTKKLMIGFDNSIDVNGAAWINVVKAGSFSLPLCLQSAGGGVSFGTSDYPRAGMRVNISGSYMPIHANNAAAIAAGLTAGDLYRTGGDPDAIVVVH